MALFSLEGRSVGALGRGGFRVLLPLFTIDEVAVYVWLGIPMLEKDEILAEL